jgi:hypothetical protein
LDRRPPAVEVNLDLAELFRQRLIEGQGNRLAAGLSPRTETRVKGAMRAASCPPARFAPLAVIVSVAVDPEDADEGGAAVAVNVTVLPAGPAWRAVSTTVWVARFGVANTRGSPPLALMRLTKACTIVVRVSSLVVL